MIHAHFKPAVLLLETRVQQNVQLTYRLQRQKEPIRNNVLSRLTENSQTEYKINIFSVPIKHSRIPDAK